MSDQKNPKKPYTPMGVLNLLKSKGVAVPVGKDFGKKANLVDAGGVPIYERPAVPETCCLLLLAFMNGSNMVPDDFHAIEKSGVGLKAYVRPDGGVYLGAFQAPQEPDGVVIVYGDPAMTTAQAGKIAMHYRARLIEQYEGTQALTELGPFAAGAVPETPPAVPQSEMDAPH